MKAYKIKEGIYWVGAIDWSLRNFHGYSTDKGSTYNAYLIIDEKITLIDNVKSPFSHQMIERIASIVDPSKIEVIISNHGEGDHSGSLPEILKLAKNAKVYSSAPNGVKILTAIYGEGLPLVGVKTNDSINIGKRNLTFYQAPMVHWPDNMVTYCKEDQILFSNDIFGQHFANSKLFDSEYDLDLLMFETKKYYANIVLPYTAQANKAFEVIKTLKFDMIATSHGIIWHSYVKEALALYEQMVNNHKEDKAVIVYDTMWESTKEMALAIAEGFMAKNIKVFIYNVNDTDKSDIVTQMFDAKYIAVGSPTFNNGMLPSVAGFIHYIKGLAVKNAKYVAFGSYGWGGQSIELIAKELDEMKLVRLTELFRHYYVPKKENLDHIKTVVANAIE